ncbi:MAG: RNA 2',3'-cyclic phosphodiesterase [Phycisphaerales bacterium]|nr:RNA 2',3'-cyclic phosphodiesterase [Planctomycetota bacterium]
MGKRLRLFVAAFPPPERAASWFQHARGLLPPGLKLPDPASVHLTLVFLGERDERELPQLTESVRRGAAGITAFSLLPRELRMLPERGQPRLLAVITDAPGQLLELQRRLASRLAQDKGKERSPFLPHLTIARFAGKTVERTSLAIAREPMEIRTIALVQSHLLPEGAKYEVLDRVELSGSET